MYCLIDYYTVLEGEEREREEEEREREEEERERRTKILQHSIFKEQIEVYYMYNIYMLKLIITFTAFLFDVIIHVHHMSRSYMYV